MLIALTGATGFIGRYLVAHLVEQGHRLRCWHRETSDRGGFEPYETSIEWIKGDLAHGETCEPLVDGCDAVVHAALYHPGGAFTGYEGDLVESVERNVVGSVWLMEAARRRGVPRFVFISTCAVHDKILSDRPLDETHPLWPMTHYGAQKAALEKFVHSYGLGEGWPICALRPTGVYGLARPPEASKWFDLVAAVVRGEAVACRRGGKEVHAADVAKAAGILLVADGVAGQAYNCYDRYVAEYDVATIAERLSGRAAHIHGERPRPKHEIVTTKLRALGMQFGGEALLEKTIGQMVEVVRK